MEFVINALTWFAIVSVGIMAGVYFAFSAFVMKSLEAIDDPGGMIAMQSINRVILRSAFLPLFFASSAVSVVLVVVAAMEFSAPGALALPAAGVVYLVGMLLVTVAWNVPLNNALEATAASGPEGSAMWRRYLNRWTAWNHVRTVSCSIAFCLFIVALAAH